jgi:GT2 family glycosyltransferase/SAM-dependent methyltransferase
MSGSYGSENRDQYYEMLNPTVPKLVPEDALKILDVGCASGAMGIHLKSLKPNREIWGIEIQAEIAKKAVGKLEKVIIGNIEQLFPLPCPLEYFDCIIFGDSLEKLIDPEQVLISIQDYLKPTGTLVTSVRNISHWSVISQQLQGQFQYEDDGLIGSNNLRFFTPQSFKDLLIKTGFQIQNEAFHVIPNEQISNILAEASAKLGINPKLTSDITSIYQSLFSAQKASVQAQDQSNFVGSCSSSLKPTTIVLATQNNQATLLECLTSIEATLGSQAKIIIVDDHSTDFTPNIIQEFAKNHKNVSTVMLQERSGIAAALNKGIEQSKTEYIVLLSPNTHLTPHWCQQLQAHFSLPNIGAVGPNSEGALGIQRVEHHVPRGTQGDFTFEAIAELLSKTNQSKNHETKLLSGFCIMLPSRVLAKIGPLDASLINSNWDLDLCYRLRQENYKLLVAADTYVNHKKDSVPTLLTPLEERSEYQASLNILYKKLDRIYGQETIPDSIELWGVDQIQPEQQLTSSENKKAGPPKSKGKNQSHTAQNFAKWKDTH